MVLFIYFYSFFVNEVCRGKVAFDDTWACHTTLFAQLELANDSGLALKTKPMLRM
jgi:hypothetical protein